MLMHIIQLTEEEDESYEFQDNSEESDAYINIYQVASVSFMTLEIVIIKIALMCGV